MIQRVTIDGIELPRLYIVENAKDAMLAMDRGIPFIRWTQGKDALIKILLRPVLEKMFPSIKWDKVLGRKRKFKTQVEIHEKHVVEKDQVELSEECESDDTKYEETQHDEPDKNIYKEEVSDDMSLDKNKVITEVASISDGERLFSTDRYKEVIECHKLDIEDYVGDMSSCVNIEVLQKLRLMPAFLGDILDCIKLNIGSGLYWREGYNKRLGLAVGRFDSSKQLPNLVILDVSGSIPRGISATMISLIDTLRTELSADLIITGSISRFYPMNSDLPTPQQIRNRFGLGNESFEFFDILAKNISGRHYGHVFSFGDNDTPTYYTYGRERLFPSMMGTVVESVHHYHTKSHDKTGYAKWCHMLSKMPVEEFNTDWCDVIYDRER